MTKPVEPPRDLNYRCQLVPIRPAVVSSHLSAQVTERDAEGNVVRLPDLCGENHARIDRARVPPGKRIAITDLTITWGGQTRHYPVAELILNEGEGLKVNGEPLEICRCAVEHGDSTGCPLHPFVDPCP